MVPGETTRDPYVLAPDVGTSNAKRVHEVCRTLLASGNRDRDSNNTYLMDEIKHTKIKNDNHTNEYSILILRLDSDYFE